MRLFKINSIAAATIMIVASVSAANAVTCPSTVTISNTDPNYRYMSFDGGVSCLGYGNEANADSVFQAASSDYVLLAKAETDVEAGPPPSGPNALDGILDATTGSLFAGLTGVIDWTPPGGYSSYAVLFKFGQSEYSWFAFELPTVGFIGALWEALDSADGSPWTGQELSHTSLYGISAVPLPAAGFLLLGGLGGLAALRRRKKTS